MTNQEQVLTARYRNNFPAFVAKAFEVLHQGEALQRNWHIDAIAHQMEQIDAGNVHRLIVNAPPRYLKSEIISVFGIAWMLGRNPGLKVICVSYNDELSTALSRPRRRLMKHPWFESVFPDARISSIKDTESEIELTQGGGCFSTSIGGSLTGRGCDVLVIDDPLKAGEAASEADRGRVNAWFSQTAFSRLNSKSEGRIVVCAQRLHTDDLCGRLLQQGGWTHLNLPAIPDRDYEIPIAKKKTFLRPKNQVLHSDREDEAVLGEIQKTIGSLLFEAQYQQNPMPAEGNLIKKEWFNRYPKSLKPQDMESIIQSWDTASKGGTSSDYSVCTTWGVLDKRIYLLNVYRARLDFPKLLQKATNLAKNYEPWLIIVENASSGLPLAQSLATDHGFPAKPMNVPKGDKKTRVSNVSALIEQGRMFLPKEAPWLSEFEREILSFPSSKYDDQVDSMTQFLWWVWNRIYSQSKSTLNAYTIGGPGGVRDHYRERTGLPVF